MSRVNEGGGRGGSGIRPSRAEREAYTNALAESLAEGRLTDTLFDERMAAAESATSFSQLDALVTDLPYDPKQLRPEHARPDLRARPVRAPGGRGSGTGLAKLLFVLPVMFGVGIAGTTIAWEVLDRPVEKSRAGFSAQAGRDVQAPGQLPRLDDAYTAVAPLSDKTISQVSEFIERHDLGYIAEVSASANSTSVFTMDASQKAHYYTFSEDQAPTGSTHQGEFPPIADMKAASRLDLSEVLSKARTDLNTDAELSSISVDTQMVDFTSRRFIDVVRVSFSGDNDEGKSGIVYRLKGMKVLETN